MSKRKSKSRIIEELRLRIEELEKENEILRNRIRELEELLNRPLVLVESLTREEVKGNSIDSSEALIRLLSRK